MLTNLGEPASEVVRHLRVEQRVQTGVGVRQNVRCDLNVDDDRYDEDLMMMMMMMMNVDNDRHDEDLMMVMMMMMMKRTYLKDNQLRMGVPRGAGGHRLVKKHRLYRSPANWAFLYWRDYS